MTPIDYTALAQERNRRDKMLRDAAPDLLAALEAVIQDLFECFCLAEETGADENWFKGATKRLNKALAAIAKAKGE